MPLVIAESVWGEQIPLDGSSRNVDRVLRRFGKVFDRRTGEKIVVPMFEESACAVQLQGQHEDRRQPPNKVTPPIQIPGTQSPDPELDRRDRQQSTGDPAGRR